MSFVLHLVYILIHFIYINIGNRTIPFRSDLRKRIGKNDIDYVKDLIRSKELSVNEVSVFVLSLHVASPFDLQERNAS